MRKSLSKVILVVIPAIILGGCFKSPQAKEKLFLESGANYLRNKDYQRAILEFRNAVQAMPGDAEPYYQLGRAYQGVGDSASAAANWNKAAELNPKHAGARIGLAEMMLGSRDRDNLREAEKLAQAVMAISPDNPDALTTLGLAELRLGKEDDGLKHLETALYRFPQHLKSSVALAGAKLRKRDLAGAEQILKTATDRDPKSSPAMVALAEFYMFVRKWSEAESAFRRASELDPNNQLALVGLAAVQTQQGRLDDAEAAYAKLAKANDEQYQPLYPTFMFHRGKRDAAIAEFTRQAEANPKSRSARTRLVAAQVLIGQVEKAEIILSAALKKNPKDTDALIQRSEIYVRLGKYSEAERDLQEVLRYRPDSAEVHYFLSRVQQSKGNREMERHELGESLRLKPNLLAARLALARSYMNARDAKASLDLINEAPADQKKLLPVIIEANWGMLAMGERTEVRKRVTDALKTSNSPDLLLQDALLKEEAKDHAGARASLTAALKQKPADVRAVDALARTYAAQKQMDAALGVVRRQADLLPSSAPLRKLLGDWLLAAGNRAEARQAFAAAKSQAGQFPAADIALARLSLAEGKVAEAKQVLEGLTKAPRSVAMEAWLLLAATEQNSGNHNSAIQHYRKVVEMEPQNVVALNNLAFLLADTGKGADEALQLAQRVKEIAPNNMAVEDTIGWAFYQKGIYATAVRHLENAVAKQPNARRRYHLALAYMKAGDTARAKQSYSTAVREDPRLPENALARSAFGQ